MRIFRSAADVSNLLGVQLGSSDWFEISQARVNLFAEATGDRQWIHINQERASSESPFGATIAHGFLTLSLIPLLSTQIYRFEGHRMGINYGLNKVRFPSPVPVGSKVQLTSTLITAVELPQSALQVTVSHTIVITNQPKPAVVADMILRVLF